MSKWVIEGVEELIYLAHKHVTWFISTVALYMFFTVKDKSPLFGRRD
jgi:hypothetical protein